MLIEINKTLYVQPYTRTHNEKQRTNRILVSWPVHNGCSLIYMTFWNEIRVTVVVFSFPVTISLLQKHFTFARYPMMSERQVVIVKEAQHLSRNIEDLHSYAENPQRQTANHPAAAMSAQIGRTPHSLFGWRKSTRLSHTTAVKLPPSD